MNNQNWQNVPYDDLAARTERYDFLIVSAPFNAAAGATTAGTIVSGGDLSGAGGTLTLATAQPGEGFAREVVFVQSDNALTTLSVVYTATVITLYGGRIVYTFTMEGDSKLVLPAPVLKVVSIVAVVTNGAASDVVNVGWRGYWLPDSYVAVGVNGATVANSIPFESINGTVSSTVTSTFPQDNFYLPSSGAATNRIILEVVTLNRGTSAFTNWISTAASPKAYTLPTAATV